MTKFLRSSGSGGSIRGTRVAGTKARRSYPTTDPTTDPTTYWAIGKHANYDPTFQLGGSTDTVAYLIGHLGRSLAGFANHFRDAMYLEELLFFLSVASRLLGGRSA